MRPKVMIKVDVILGFEFSRGGPPIHIVRTVTLSITNKLIESLKPKEAYEMPPRKTQTPAASNIVEGEKPVSSLEDRLLKKIPLSNYAVPPLLCKLLNRGLKESDDLSSSQKQHLKRIK